MPDKLLTYEQASKRLSISERGVKRLIAVGKLPVVTPTPGTRRVKASDIQRYIENLKPANMDAADVSAPQHEESHPWQNSTKGRPHRTGGRVSKLRAAKQLAVRLKYP